LVGQLSNRRWQSSFEVRVRSSEAGEKHTGVRPAGGGAGHFFRKRRPGGGRTPSASAAKKRPQPLSTPYSAFNSRFSRLFGFFEKNAVFFHAEA
jgi:hypothetical protein